MDALKKPQMPTMSETKDISKKGLVALVLLTVVISLIGSFLVLNEISRSQVIIHDEKPVVGTAQLGVIYPQNNPPIKPAKPASTGSTGYATLQIQKNPNAEMKKYSTAATTAEKITEKKQESKKVPSQSQNSNLYYYENRGANYGYFE